MELENIDDDCDQNDIAFVKIDDDHEAAEWGIDEIPTIVSVLNPYFFNVIHLLQMDLEIIRFFNQTDLLLKLSI